MNKEKRKKMSLEIIPAIIIKFKGVEHEEGFPYLPDDDGVVVDFLKFCLANEIWTIRCGGSSGGGSYIMAHLPKNQDTIVKWFEEHGVKATVYSQDWDYKTEENDEK